MSHEISRVTLPGPVWRAACAMRYVSTIRRAAPIDHILIEPQRVVSTDGHILYLWDGPTGTPQPILVRPCAGSQPERPHRELSPVRCEPEMKGGPCGTTWLMPMRDRW